MDWPTLLADFLDLFFRFLPSLIASVVVFLSTLFIASFVSAKIDALLVKRGSKLEIRVLLSRMTKWGIRISGVVWALSIVGFNVTGFIAGLGITGLIIGFALQDISRNFTAGALLMLQEPFNFGDYIEVAGYEGTVTDIQLRATELLAPDGVRVLIPNGDVFTSTIRNFTKTNLRRIELKVGVAYESDLEQVTRVALEAIHAVPGLLDDPVPMLFFHTFGDSAIEFSLRYWFDTSENDVFSARDMGVKAIKTAFEREGIEIPYPIRTVRLSNARDA
ncbi:MAG TPA: mechanosensitive ion channel [Anaerolineae bacterium]|nr:mechanosensitive ion channel [Anaerolineae bacterium]